MSIVYIGPFPINGGGVTNKNRDLFDALIHNGLRIEKIDLHKITKRKSIIETIRLGLALISRNNRFIVGISTGKNTRRNFCKLLYTINKSAMRKSIILIMGGMDDKNIVKDQAYRKWMSCYKTVYVETKGMKKNLEEAGMDNIAIYPNGRFKPVHKIPERSIGKTMKCIFFSLIQPEKGADLVLEAATSLRQVQFTFYGQIVDTYKDSFLKQVSNLPNVSYQGIFQGSSEEIYEELAKYDVLLFPTQWETEGVPGILVEGKIAGLAEIVSNKSHNAEIVTDGKDGIVMKNYTVDDLIFSIQMVMNDRFLLKQMKCCSKKSGEYYFIENNISDIILKLGGAKLEFNKQVKQLIDYTKNYIQYDASFIAA